MTQSQLLDFLNGAGDKPYRELVQYHIKRTSTRDLQKAVLGETSLLPEWLQSSIVTYIDETNDRFGYDSVFWAQATCRQAFEAIMNVAIKVLPMGSVIASIDDALNPKNHEMAFQLFQIPTLSFAYSASTQRKQRKFMGMGCPHY